MSSVEARRIMIILMSILTTGLVLLARVPLPKDRPPQVERLRGIMIGTEEVDPLPCTLQARNDIEAYVRLEPTRITGYWDVLEPSNSYPVIGHNGDRAWYLIIIADQEGWVASQHTYISGDCSRIPFQNASEGTITSTEEPGPAEKTQQTLEQNGEIVIEGLTGPQGLHVDADGTVWVIDTGLGGEEAIESIDPSTFEVIPAQFGNTAQIVRWTPGDETEGVASLPSVFAADEAIGGGRVTVLDGVVYATVGVWQINQGEAVTTEFFGQVVRVEEDGSLSTVADLWAHELANNPDGTGNIETHPYGIAAGADGLLYVTDAAGNSLLSVDPATGEVQTIASFEGLPGVFPSQFRNGELLTDPVPTNVVVNEDGSFFVSFLSGAPFVPGSAKVVSVSAEGEVSDFATGLTMLVDVTRGPDGNLYAVQFGMFTETGPVPNSGAVYRIFADGTWEPIIVGLPFATAIAIDANGNGYVAINGVTIPGAGAVVYYEGLTSMEAVEMPMTEMPDTPMDDMETTPEPSN